jgi:hypothetical protein
MHFLDRFSVVTHFQETVLPILHMIQWDVHTIRLLANQHCVPMAECGTSNILATEANVESLD